MGESTRRWQNTNAFATPSLRQISAADARLLPFEEPRWRNSGQYRDCVNETMKALASAGLYDRAIGQQVIYTNTVLGLLAR